jgi:hypothetical protein
MYTHGAVDLRPSVQSHGVTESMILLEGFYLKGAGLHGVENIFHCTTQKNTLVHSLTESRIFASESTISVISTFKLWTACELMSLLSHDE